MTKQEIIDAIEKGIEGQGTMVDLGGVLPKVLKAIVDALPEGGASPIAPEPAIAINAQTMASVTVEKAATSLGITVDEVRSLPKQLVIRTQNSFFTLTRICFQVGSNFTKASFGNTKDDPYVHFSISIFDDTVSTSYDVL